MKIETPEYYFLLHLLRLYLGKNESIHTDFETLDWRSLRDLACYHQVRPLVFESLFKFYNHIGNDEIKKLKNEVLGITAFNLQQFTELNNLIALFKNNDIEIIPYKGLVLSESVFDSFAKREFADIDFLFQKKDFFRVKSILLERGYLPEKNISRWFEKYYLYHHCEYNFTFSQSNERKFIVEPHWFLGTRMLQNNFSWVDVFPLTKKAKLASLSSANLLGPEGLLLTTCIHHTSMRFPTLKSIMDIAALLSKYRYSLDWDKLLAVSDQWKIKNLLLFSVYLAYSKLEAPLPEAILILIKKNLPSPLLNNNSKYVFDGGVEPFTLKYHFKRISLQFLVRPNLYIKAKILWFTILYYATFRVFVSR